MQRFWTVEEGATCHDKTANGECEQYFRDTTTRDASGRFVVRIPFKPEVRTLGDSRKMAEKRLYSIERKLSRNVGLRREYVAFMQEYQDLGHMTRIAGSRETTSGYYLPHHAVFKQTSTTKLRVVFDGSAQTTAGLSVNEVQKIGPTVQDTLLAIALRFRRHRYVLSADVEKMYRQILIAPDERCYQRILWRPDDSFPIQTYELNTVTYGTASAPFLATKVLTQLGEDNAVTFPAASRAIMKDFYVDDLLTGANTIDEVRILWQQISQILSTAGFTLRKWASNDPRTLDKHDERPQRVEIKADKDPKTLGLL